MFLVNRFYGCLAQIPFIYAWRKECSASLARLLSLSSQVGSKKKTDYFFHGAGSRNALRRCTRSCYLRRTSHRIALFPSCAPTGRGHSSLCHDEAGLRSLSECGDFFYVVQGCIDGRGLKISKKPKHENIMGAA